MRTGGRILVDQLELNGVDLAFCLPGESYLPVLDALYDSPIRLVSCRHEQGAANAAEAYGKLTGRPGICLVTRGPGATQAAVGVHTAKQDSSPMLLLVGQVPRAFRGREAWQELDYARGLRRDREGGVGGGQRRADPRARGRGVLDRALRPARAGRARAARGRSRGGGRRRRRRPRSRSERDRAARRGPRAAARAARRCRAPARRRRRGRLDGRDEPRRAGVLRGERASRSRARSAARTSSTTARRATSACSASRWTSASPRGFATPTSCSRSAAGSARCRRGATRSSSRRTRGRRSSTCIPIPASSAASTSPTSRSSRRFPSSQPRCARSSLSSRAGASGRQPRAPTTRRTSGTSRWRATGRPRRDHGVPSASGSPATPIQTCGAGNFTVWAHRFAEFTQFGTQACPRSGSMGYGLAAAVAAKLVHPDRIVVCFTGDGDFVMSSPELATAVQYDLPIVVLLVNNGMYATIRMHQERQFPGRVDRNRPREPGLPRARPARTARTASGSSARRTSRRRSSARSPPGSRRCSSFRSIRSGSARASG